MNPWLSSVQGGLAAPPIAQLELIFETLTEEPPFPLNRGKGRIDEIKYPGGGGGVRISKIRRVECFGCGT